jgi:drug/metabolite transporter (DMT)-like permease
MGRCYDLLLCLGNSLVMFHPGPGGRLWGFLAGFLLAVGGSAPMAWSTRKPDHRTVITVALILCLGMTGFWFIVHALADDLDPIGPVAARASLISLVLAFMVGVFGAAWLYRKNKAAREKQTGRRHRRLQRSRNL